MDAVAILESSTFAVVGGLGKLLNSRNSIFALTCLICWMKLPQIEIWYISNLAGEYIPLSHPLSPIYVCVCVCVSQIKKRYSVLSSHPTSVRCDIEKGFITCSATLTAACSFGVSM